MGLLGTVAELMGTSITTGVRRQKRGPLRPGWSFTYEATVAFMKAINERIIHAGGRGRRPRREKARATGVRAHLEVWPEMVHNFQTFGEGFPEAVRGTAKLCEHLVSCWDGPRGESLLSPNYGEGPKSVVMRS